MRTLIRLSFITTFLVLTVLSAQAALDPALMLYFTFDEQLDGKVVEDMTGGGHNGKLKFGAKITNEPAEVYKGAGALKIFNNISAQFRVDEFDRMNKYGENTYTFWLYIYGVRDDPCCPEEIILQKANILVGDVKGNAPAIFLTDPGLSLTYKFGDQGAVGIGVGPDGEGEKFELNKWYHIAGVKKASDLIIYIDGKETARYNVKRDFIQGKGHLRIGATQIRSASFAMDEFQLYDRPLTAEEVGLDAKGQLLSVKPKRKLTTTWGRLKTGR
jgi:hypothetical protein